MVWWLALALACSYSIPHIAHMHTHTWKIKYTHALHFLPIPLIHKLTHTYTQTEAISTLYQSICMYSIHACHVCIWTICESLSIANQYRYTRIEEKWQRWLQNMINMYKITLLIANLKNAMHSNAIQNYGNCAQL